MNHQLLQAIRQALGAAITPNLTTQSHGFDLYEAYVFALGIRAVRNLHLQVVYKNTDRRVAPVFLFRTSPGNIARGLYTHAEIDLGRGKPAIEAHVGVRVMGLSKIDHELDYSVLLKEEAEFCRRNDVLPRHNKVILAAECKFYTEHGVGIAMGRGFLGLSDELGHRDTFFVMNRPAPRVDRLLDKHNRWGCFSPVVPGSPEEQNRLIGSIQTVLKKYRSCA